MRYAVKCLDSREGPFFKHKAKTSFEFNILFPMCCCLQNSILYILFIFLFPIHLFYSSLKLFALTEIYIAQECSSNSARRRYINIIHISICKRCGAEKKSCLVGILTSYHLVHNTMSSLCTS